jgi:hypothetical protein
MRKTFSTSPRLRAAILGQWVLTGRPPAIDRSLISSPKFRTKHRIGSNGRSRRARTGFVQPLSKGTLNVAVGPSTAFRARAPHFPLCPPIPDVMLSYSKRGSGPEGDMSVWSEMKEAANWGGLKWDEVDHFTIGILDDHF